MARALAAAGVALPIAAILWFEIVYLWYGATGADLRGPAGAAIAALAFGLSVAWALYGANRTATAIHRACRLGIGVAIALPIVSVAVLLLWERASGRPDLGMGGLALYALPVVAFIAAIVLVIVFGIGRRLAAKRMVG